MADLDLIPMAALRAVDAVARLDTLSRAGAELGLTPGAVSQRIQKAEDGRGRVLFHRSAAGMAPTDLCREMMPALSRGMADLSRAVAMAQDAGRARYHADDLGRAAVCGPGGIPAGRTRRHASAGAAALPRLAHQGIASTARLGVVSRYAECRRIACPSKTVSPKDGARRLPIWC